MRLSASLDLSQVFQVINEEPVSITCSDVYRQAEGYDGITL